MCSYNRLISQVSRVFTNSPADLGSIPCRVIPKTFKMVLDTALLNTQQYKIRIKGKVEQSREKSCALPYTKCSSYLKGILLVALDYGRHLTYAQFHLLTVLDNVFCNTSGDVCLIRFAIENIQFIFPEQYITLMCFFIIKYALSRKFPNCSETSPISRKW